MDVGVSRSMYNSYCLSRHQRSDSEVLSVRYWRALLRCSANPGDLRTFHEDSHFEQFIMRLGYLVISHASQISIVAAAYSCRPNFWFGRSDSVSRWNHRGDSLPVFTI